MNRLLRICLLARLATMTTAAALGQATNGTRDFQVVRAEPQTTNGQTRFFLETIRGTERSNNSLNRLSIVSADQRNYTTPESGCGPTAMLNILIWYEKYGLIAPVNRNAHLAFYKRALFNEIDRRLTEQAGIARTAERGANSAGVAIVMDRILQERSQGQLRMHTEYIQAPLQLDDLLATMPNFRSGYVSVLPKDPLTGKLRRPHAATLIRADRAGYITLATWGELYRGLLKTRPDGQWFIPQDPAQLELKVTGLTRFIPFQPTTAADR